MVTPYRDALAPFALLALGLLGAAAMEVFGPASVRFAYRHIDLGGVPGLLAAFVAFVAVLTLHELGHLAGAIVMRFKVTGVTLGPLRVERKLGRNSCRFILRNWFKGAVSAVPMDDRHWRARVLTVVAAGPGASLMSAAVAVYFLPGLQPNSWLVSALSLFAALNFLVFFLGLIPNGRYARKRNDAQFFLSLLCNSDDALEIKLYHQLVRLQTLGVAPRDYPADLIVALTQHAATLHSGKPLPGRSKGGRTDMRLAFAEAVTKCAVDREKCAAANECTQSLATSASFSPHAGTYVSANAS
jgi:hypothetical protein